MVTNERIKVQEEKLMKKDVEFSGDIQDIKTKADRDVTKITQHLT